MFFSFGGCILNIMLKHVGSVYVDIQRRFRILAIQDKPGFHSRFEVFLFVKLTIHRQIIHKIKVIGSNQFLQILEVHTHQVGIFLRRDYAVETEIQFIACFRSQIHPFRLVNKGKADPFGLAVSSNFVFPVEIGKCRIGPTMSFHRYSCGRFSFTVDSTPDHPLGCAAQYKTQNQKSNQNGFRDKCFHFCVVFSILIKPSFNEPKIV